MVYEIENLFEKFKDLDKNFQLIPGADGHVLFVPRRNPAFLVGKALHKVDSETDFPAEILENYYDFLYKYGNVFVLFDYRFLRAGPFGFVQIQDFYRDVNPEIVYKKN